MCQILLLLMNPYSYAMHAKFVLMHRVRLPYYVLYEVLIVLPFVKKLRTILVLHFFSNKYLE